MRRRISLDELRQLKSSHGLHERIGALAKQYRDGHADAARTESFMEKIRQGRFRYPLELPLVMESGDVVIAEGTHRSRRHPETGRRGKLSRSQAMRSSS